ncbi:MAG: heparan-alpha-glucosaminide N-acetyltransferase domain-containing protein [Bacteroidota bacterium]|mgnify:CR=1 FL=1
METKQRLLALDVFRGLTVAFMILVNNAGSLPTAYPALLHAKWHGCTPTDLVFPFFLFIVGIAVTFSLTQRKAAGENVYKKILLRTALIVGIGIFLNGAPAFDLATWRIPGVLTRIGIVYGITALIFMRTNARQQFWIAIACLLSYWALMTLIPVPGYGVASLEEGKDLGAWIDRSIFGNHLYMWTKVYDPEGLLSTITSVATCLAGVLTGTWLRQKIEDLSKWAGLFAVGFLLFLLGLLWGEVFPINKKIWTSSYVLYHSGLALLTLGTVWWLVDKKGYRGWTSPFVWFGMNPLFIYITHEVIDLILFSIPVGESNAFEWTWRTFYASWLPENLASLLFALTHVAVNLLIAWGLWRRKIFIRV